MAAIFLKLKTTPLTTSVKSMIIWMFLMTSGQIGDVAVCQFRLILCGSMPVSTD